MQYGSEHCNNELINQKEIYLTLKIIALKIIQLYVVAKLNKICSIQTP